jgi:translation initiation factor 4E
LNPAQDLAFVHVRIELHPAQVLLTVIWNCDDASDRQPSIFQCGVVLLNQMQNLLETEWQFWLVLFMPGAGGKHQYQIEEIIRVSTVQNFWQYYTALPAISELRQVNHKHVSIALFRGQIKPAWEDENNAHGGTFFFMVPRDVVDELWKDLLLSAIGGTLHDHLTAGNLINGLVVSPKQEGFYGIEIWTNTIESTDGGNSKMKAFLSRLESAGGTVGNVTFKTHTIH